MLIANSSPTASAVRDLPALAVPVQLPQPAPIRAAFAAGVHPASALPVATCGGCALLIERERAEGAPATKCSRGAGSRGGVDVRPEWPACESYTSR